MDIVAGLAALAQALSITKSLRELDKSFGDAEPAPTMIAPSVRE